MALNAVTLAALMKTKIENSGVTVNEPNSLLPLADAIVEHITTAGIVSVTAVTPGTGTAPGTIT